VNERRKTTEQLTLQVQLLNSAFTSLADAVLEEIGAFDGGSYACVPHHSLSEALHSYLENALFSLSTPASAHQPTNVNKSNPPTTSHHQRSSAVSVHRRRRTRTSSRPQCAPWRGGCRWVVRDCAVLCCAVLCCAVLRLWSRLQSSETGTELLHWPKSVIAILSVSPCVTIPIIHPTGEAL